MTFYEFASSNKDLVLALAVVSAVVICAVINGVVRIIRKK